MTFNKYLVGFFVIFLLFINCGNKNTNFNNTIVEIDRNIEDGKVTDFHSNGETLYIGEFKNGMKVGKWEIFDEKGVKVSEYNYNPKGNLNGVSFHKDSLGNYIYKGKFNDGKLIEYTKTIDHIWKLEAVMSSENIEDWFVYKNNIRVAETHFINSNGVGKWILYSENGKTIIQEVLFSKHPECLDTPNYKPYVSELSHDFPPRFRNILLHRYQHASFLINHSCINYYKEFDAEGRIHLEVLYDGKTKISEKSFELVDYKKPTNPFRANY